MSGNDMDRFPVETGKHAFPRMKCIPNGRLQPPGHTHIQNNQVPGH